MIDEEEFLTIGEVAKELGVSRVTVWKWLNEGKIRDFARTITGRYYIQRAEVKRLKEELKRHETKVFSTNGYSLAVRIPKKWLDELGIKEGEKVVVIKDKTQIIITKKYCGGDVD